MREQTILSEALGRALIAEPVASASVLSGVLIADAPVSEERQRLGEGIADGQLIVTPALQDSIGAWCTTPVSATRQEGGFVLNGAKQFVDAARSATDFLVTAMTVEGNVLLSAPARTRGLSIAERPGIDGAAIATVSFVECFIPSEGLLASGEQCGAILDAALLRARLALAAELAGLASAALERTVAYTRDRVQFGKPIASFQSIQHRLVEMWMDAEFACAAVGNAVGMLATGDGLGARLAVLAAKARAGDAAFSICRRAVHLHGAMGFTDECDIGIYLKRAISLNASLGQPEQLRLQFVNLERAA
jgi:alkylation response protein AidB-like acyl-CoA dehydrogenase